MRFFKRGETVDTKITFIDSDTSEVVDVNDPQYKITHFDGPVEIIDVPVSVLTKVAASTGEYIINWTIPTTVPENETYFVAATGVHPVTGTTTIVEDFFRVLPASFFSGGGGSGTGMQIKFTKP